MSPKDELLTLVADLDDDTAAEVLACARWLVAEGQTRVTPEDLSALVCGWCRHDDSS